MDGLLEQLAAEPWGRLVLRYLTSGGIANVYFFLLVSARLAGTIVVAPSLIVSHIPLACRIGLVVFLSFIIAPTVTPSLGAMNEITLVAGSSSTSSPLPESAVALFAVLVSELAVGTLFGVGLVTMLSGLRLAAEWIDRHCGLLPGASGNSEWSGDTSSIGLLIPLLGVAVLLLLQPTAGHSQLLKALLQSFHDIPVGEFDWTMTAVPLLNHVVQESLLLGLRLAMPLVATMTLVEVTLALASRGSAAPTNTTCQTIRLATSLIVLALTLTTFPDVIANTVTAMIGN